MEIKLNLNYDSANSYCKDNFVEISKGESGEFVFFEIDDPKRIFSINKEELIKVLSIM